MRTELAKLTLPIALAVLVAPMALAQSGNAQNRPPVPATIPPPAAAQSLPRPDFHFPRNVGRTYKDSDPPTFPQVVRRPKGAPNVLLILLDDVGFGQFSAFGGGVPSPNIEKLAAHGLRYTRFHTTALCSPTRAALRENGIAAERVMLVAGPSPRNPKANYRIELMRLDAESMLQ
jgi:arylsulfatase